MSGGLIHREGSGIYRVAGTPDIFASDARNLRPPSPRDLNEVNMRFDKYFRLCTLGGLALETVDGETTTPIALRPRHLAILAVLACSRRAVRRDALAAMFWGEETDAKARHSLSNSLSALRAVLGQTAVTARRDVIELSTDVPLAVDALEFAAVCESRDDARAAQLYEGPFLHDVDFGEAPDFEAWVARERSRLERLFLALCERHVPALLRDRDWDACAALAERWLSAAPRSTLAFSSLLRARSGPDSPAAIRAALADYDRLDAWLEREYDIHADPVIGDVAAELRRHLVVVERSLAGPLSRPVAPAEMEASGSVAAISISSDGVSERVPPAGSIATRRRWPSVARHLALAAAAVTILAAFLVRSSRASHAAPPPSGRTIVAITGIANLRGDTALAWLEDGLPQLISDELAAGGTLEPVAPMRVHDVLVRQGSARGSALSQSEAIDIARRVGATWSVRGGLSGGSGAYILNLEVRDVSTGGEVESFTVMADGPVKLGQLAAARLLDMATTARGSAGDPPRFTAATASPEAYRHLVLGLRFAQERRFPDDERELDAAIALDSSFVDALLARRDLANMRGEKVTAHLDSLIQRHAGQMSEWDRLRGETYRAMYDAEVERSEALAARLVERYPRDPRAYDARADVLSAHGKWLAADSLYQRELSLDSLAIEAGDGPCAPCTAYSGLVGVRLSRGDLAGAERAARRWVALQPGVPGSWEMLSTSLEFEGKFDEAIEAARRMVSLTSDPTLVANLARTYIIARRFHEADSLIDVLKARTDQGHAFALDLAVTMSRERGDFRRAAALSDATVHSIGLDLLQGDNLARLGRIAKARKWFEASGHLEAPREIEAFNAPQARAFAWAHALEGDALWRAGDTVAVHALADSVRVVGARSYYGRDWVLYHHLNGLLALSRRDTATAERELTAARYGVAGWTATIAWLARIRIAHGDGDAAVALLRDAYKSPLDAMGRYVTRADLDELMVRAFERAGKADSARVYAARVSDAKR